MNRTEERLRAALAARAELVRDDHLAAEPPEPAKQSTHWWSRGGNNTMLIAAVLILVVGIPLLALGLTKDSDRAPDPTKDTDPAHLEADIDGDGVDETVTLVRGEPDANGRAPTRVTVEFSQFPGETATHRLGKVGEVAFEEPADVDGRNGMEVFLSIDSEFAEGTTELTVLAFRDGTLAQITERPVVEGFEDGRLAHWWVADGRLFSMTSTRPVSEDDKEYPVEAVRWDPGEGSLTEVPLEGQCVTAAEPDELHDCGVASAAPSDQGGSENEGSSGEGWWEQTPDGLPSSYGLVTGTPALSADADGDGADETVSVDETDTGSELVVEDVGQTTKTPLPADAPLVEAVASLPGSSAPVIAVSTQDGFAGDGQIETEYGWAFYTYDGGRLTQLRVDGSPLPTGQVDDTGQPRLITTWLAGDRLYTMEYLDDGTRTTTHPDHPDGLTVFEVRVHEWSVSGSSLQSTVLGDGCVTDLVDRLLTACPEG